MLAAAGDLGMRVADTLTIDVAHEATRASLTHAVATDPSVLAVAASWPSASGNPSEARLRPSDSDPRDGTTADAAPRQTDLFVHARFVSFGYLPLLGIDVVRGRGFAPTERGVGAGVILLSETAARTLWPHSDAIGQRLRVYGEGPPEAPSDPSSSIVGATVSVVGVVRDVGDTVRFTMLPGGPTVLKTAGAMAYWPIGLETPASSIVARVNGDVDVARKHLLARVTSIDPAAGDIRTMRAATATVTYVMWLAFALLIALAGLALALTLSGIFSVLSYVIEQRRKEIGVRMTLGATSADIVRLVMVQTAKPVVLGVGAGTWLAAGLATMLLKMPPRPQGFNGAVSVRLGDVVHVWDRTAYALSLFVIVTACASAALIPAVRASRLDPTVSLKQE
jgi:hypothetical protein